MEVILSWPMSTPTVPSMSNWPQDLSSLRILGEVQLDQEFLEGMDVEGIEVLGDEEMENLFLEAEGDQDFDQDFEVNEDEEGGHSEASQESEESDNGDENDDFHDLMESEDTSA